MARCQCGGGSCNCVIVGGDNATVTGGGSNANPYVVNAEVPCDDVRPCVSAGLGVTYDVSTGVIGANISPAAGNNLAIRPDGGLFVPTGAATVATGCGLTGDGSGSNPVRAAVGAWPYPCTPEDAGGVVVCDSNGVLRSEPRGKATFTSFSEERTYPDVRIPSGSVKNVGNFSVTITNPDTCRPALVIVEREVDIFVVLPAGAGAATGFDGDEMWYMRNTGTGTISGAHSQATKVLSSGTVGPGASMPIGYGAAVGRGSGGAYYYRINAIIRALLISL